MLQTLTFNGPRVVNAEASFFRYESGSAGGADEGIKLRADGQDLGVYYPGDSVELPDRRAMWEITPTTAAAAGIVRLGVGRVQSARLVGTVSVIDGERSKVLSGVCFRAAPSVVAGNAPCAQLYNPAASGKNLFATAVRVGAQSADAWGLRTTATQYGTAGPTPVNLDSTSGAAAVALIRTDALATAPASPKFYASGFLQASSDVVIVLPRPILIRPGNGLDVYVNGNPNTIRANFEWEEWPI